jgi:hypothetical protein
MMKPRVLLVLPVLAAPVVWAACSTHGTTSGTPPDGATDGRVDGEPSDASHSDGGPTDAASRDGGGRDAPADADAGLTHWFPGHYAGVTAGAPSASEATERDTLLTEKDLTPFVGLQIEYDWPAFETSEGDYDAGLSALDTDLAAVDAAGKKLVLLFQYKNFAKTGPAIAVPAYLRDAGPWCVPVTDGGGENCGQCPLGNGAMAIVWQGQDAGGTADRLHAWIAATGEHVMKGKHASVVAGVAFPESAGGCSGDEGYKPGVYVGGLEADVVAAGQAFPGVPVFQYINFISDDKDDTKDLEGYANWAKGHPFAGAGCPDVAPAPYPDRPDGCTTQAFTNAPPGYAVLRDAAYQGVIPFDVAIEYQDYLKCATPSLQTTYDTAVLPASKGGMAAQYVVWFNFKGNTSDRFNFSDVSSFIADAGPFPNRVLPTW